MDKITFCLLAAGFFWLMGAPWYWALISGFIASEVMDGIFA